MSTVNNLLVQSDNGRGNRFWFPCFLGGKIMRLDKYLKVSRLIKRRTVANEACDAGRVLVNDKPAKASVQVKTGDTVEIQFEAVM